MEVEFRNVTITLANVKDARQAYDRLCHLLAQYEPIEWTTDTYVVHPEAGEPDIARSTNDLFEDLS